MCTVERWKGIQSGLVVVFVFVCICICISYVGIYIYVHILWEYVQGGKVERETEWTQEIEVETPGT